MFGKPVAQLRIFAAVLSQIGKAERHEIDELDVLSELALNLPYEDAERQFRTLVSWGRHADLFDHDPERHKLFVEIHADLAVSRLRVSLGLQDR